VHQPHRSHLQRQPAASRARHKHARRTQNRLPRRRNLGVFDLNREGSILGMKIRRGLADLRLSSNVRF
jgi:hypothetical protein